MDYKFETLEEAESMSRQVKNLVFGKYWYVEHKIEGNTEKGFDILVKVLDNQVPRAKLALSQYRGVRFEICP